MEQPFILCGLGRVGWRVFEFLRAAGLPVVVVDNHCTPNDPRLERTRLVRGDCRSREVLLQAGVTQARGVLILTSDDLINIATALTVRHLHPEVRVVLRVFNQNLINRLGKAVRNVFALSTATLTAPLLALTAQAGQALGAFRIDGLRDGKRQVSELAVAPGSPLLGRTVADATLGRQVLVLAHFPAGQHDRFLLEVDPEARLRSGDRLIVCGEPRDAASLLAEGKEDAAPHVLWAGTVRRLGRVFWRTLVEMDRAVQVCTLILVAVVLAGTLVFRFGVAEIDNIAVAFYRTISIMATAADMHGDAFQEGWPKVFVGMLRMVGVALTAAFTALFTNYLLRARLSGALEIRRIPDSGHIIVCGLGNIGYRVVEELVRSGERVVAIEADRDSRFVPTVRRLGVAVITGDAAVAEVLRQSHVVTARAVIVATSNDLVNLEVTLLVRELNDRQRVVLCLTDTQLAQTLREAANVGLAVSVPQVSAPAFVAALFGDRVPAVVLIKGRMLAVVDLQVQPQDAFLAGQPLRVVAVDYQLLPVAIVAADGSTHPRTLNARLSAGDRLIAFVALPDLERLLRRDAVPNHCAVEVTAVPLPARGPVAQLLRLQEGIGGDEAEKRLDHLPLRLGSNLTRGQAENLLYLLRKERVTAHLAEGDGAP